MGDISNPFIMNVCHVVELADDDVELRLPQVRKDDVYKEYALHCKRCVV